MIRLLCLLLIMFAPPLRAESIIVRGGEHPGFTRLVFQVDAPIGWSVTAVPEGWDLRLGVDAAHFDVTQAWRLITRERLIDLRILEGNLLRLVSDCACHIRRWRFNGRPVIDIHDGQPRANRGDIARHEDTITKPASSPPSDGKPTRADPRPLPLAHDPELDAAVDKAARGDTKLPPASPERVAALAEARRRAAELEASLRGILGEGEKPAKGPGNPAEAGYGVQPGSDTPLEVQTPDPVHVPKPPRHGLTADGRICPDPSVVDPTQWVAESEVTPDFSQAHSGLMGEFDLWDKTATLAAARHYLYFGFGAEARQLLIQLAEPSDLWETLLDLADVLDSTAEGPTPVAAHLDGWESCPSMAALWAILAGPDLGRGQPVAADAVVAAFQSLPAHLRQLLGPRLIEAFIATGDMETARKLRNLMALGHQDASPDSILAEAGVEAAHGSDEEARRIVDNALDRIKPNAPELLLEQARQRLAQSQPLENAEHEILEALAFEYRRQPLGTEIQKALVDSQIILGDFLAARQRLEEKLSAQDVSALFRKLYQAASGAADGATLLRLTLPEARGLGTTPRDAEIREALASRLITLGFFHEALVILGPALSEAGSRFAVAAHLGLGAPEAALTQLGEQSGPEALALRARVYAEMGNLEKARALYVEAGRRDEASDIALLQEDWAGAAARDDAIAEAARLLTAPPTLTEDEPYSLAEDLLGISARERETFEILADAMAPALSN